MINPDTRRERAHPSRPGLRRERWIAAALLVLLVLLRSAVFVFWEEAQFDADQAVMGLMAKHISEGRAFPVFFYGSNHILAVEAWLAAGVFLVAGASVTTLKLPLLALNLLAALLLLRILERESGLRPGLALLPILFFALPAPGTAAAFVEPSGGNMEPLLYVLLLWTARHRPVLSGILFGVGFLHREFTLYGLVALLALHACRGRSVISGRWKHWASLLTSAAGVWLLAQLLRSLSSSVSGPGTSLEALSGSRSNLAELAGRMCLDLLTLPEGASKLVTLHWPMLFGASRHPLLGFGIDSPLVQGAPAGPLLLAATMILAGAGIAHRLLRERSWRPEFDFCAYLVLTGALSVTGYIVGRCGALDLMRYDLLSVLGAVGLTAWYFCGQPGRWPTVALGGLVVACALMTTVPNVRMLADYIAHPQVRPKRLIARHLEARGIRYGTSDYWLAYSLTFLTNERVILASEDFVRIASYERIVDARRDESVRILRAPCEGGTPVAGVWFCPPK